MSVSWQVTTFVEKEENSCIKDFVEKSLKDTRLFLRRESQVGDNTMTFDDTQDEEMEIMLQRHKKKVPARLM